MKFKETSGLANHARENRRGGKSQFRYNPPKPKITDIPEARYNALMSNDDMPLTPEEIKSGWHFCYDWDGLLIGFGMAEMAHCTCLHLA